MRILWKPTCLLFCFLSLFLASPSFANPRTGFLDLSALQKAAERVTLEAYPDADDVLLDDYVLTTYEKDGKAVTWDDWGSKILTEKGNRTIGF